MYQTEAGSSMYYHFFLKPNSRRTIITKIIPTENIFKYPKSFNKRIEEKKIERSTPRLKFISTNEKKHERQIKKSMKKNITGENITLHAL